MKYAEHTPLIIAVALPIMFILGVIVFALPHGSVTTSYDVIYARCPQQGGMWHPCAIHADAAYVIEGQHIRKRVVPPQVAAAGEKPVTFVEPKLYSYSATTHESTRVDDAELVNITLRGIDESPDGAHVEYRYGRGSDFFPFTSGVRSSGFYIIQENARQRINITGDAYEGADTIEVLGWVEKVH